MNRRDVIRALRCSATCGEHDCRGCAYLSVETLNVSDAITFGRSQIESCDVDRIVLDAAALLEEDAK